LRIAVLALPFVLTGCMSSSALHARLERIKDEHNVTVVARNPLSRCYLFGNLPGLLNTIDSSLDRCPQYFKDHIGPVCIEETFADNSRTYPVPFLVRGYVDPREGPAGFPIHIKNRSLAEKLVFWAARDDELFLHEASHSFEANVLSQDEAYWSLFNADFDNSRSGGFNGVMAVVGCLVFPPLTYVRPRGSASLYGLISHWEDFAETHCYLRRYEGNIESLLERDPAFYWKLQAVERFTRGRRLLVAKAE
jgi:hypothetical protein